MLILSMGDRQTDIECRDDEHKGVCVCMCGAGGGTHISAHPLHGPHVPWYTYIYFLCLLVIG